MLSSILRCLANAAVDVPARLSVCGAQLRQSFPKNLPLLTAFTTAWALYVGVFSLMFTRGSVIRAVFQAAFVVGENEDVGPRIEERVTDSFVVCSGSTAVAFEK